MDEVLQVTNIESTDIDSADPLLTAVSLGINVASRGTWELVDGTDVKTLSETTIGSGLANRRLVFTPALHGFSDPIDEPMSVLFYEIRDEANGKSGACSIKVFVEYQPAPIYWVGPVETETLEDTSVLIILNDKEFYETTDPGQVRLTLTSGPLDELERGGYFYTCDVTSCRNFTAAEYARGVPFPPSGIVYQPPPNAFGDDFTHFTFRIEVLDPNGQPTPTGTREVTFTIHVIPVNDPPTIHPDWAPFANAGGENVCDEQTDTFPVVAFFRFKFRGRDIDNTCGQIEAEILNFLDPLVGTVYVCGERHQEGYRGPDKGSYNCSDGIPLKTITRFPAYAPAHFELSIIPYPHWNGIIELDLVIWDPELFSYSANFKLRVRPINDLPSVVAGKTSVGLEYYEKVADGLRAITCECAEDTPSFKVIEHESRELRETGGETIKDQEGTASTSGTAAIETENDIDPEI
jgi:hypothetical protein